ncbi:hypothetical protein ACLQ25_24210 [Micromonospora sp. DT44]|uniref:hypothetical protein n=1 Tax=Micromonospora sp. DT44 TaxID=3393439 RepID=UPI003CF31C24
MMRPCTLCAARRGARIPALVRLDHGELPICVQHRRTLVGFRDEQPRRGRPLGPFGPPTEQSLDATPEILTAVRRRRALRRRRRATIDAAMEAAGQITSGWRNWPRRRGESDAITTRWGGRSELLPRVVEQVIRYPETIALATVFARHPQLLNTPRAATGDPTPMMFLLHAAHYLQHPEPGQLLRRHHPLFRWAGADDLPNWRWRNSSEPDRSIHAALRADNIEPLRLR